MNSVYVLSALLLGVLAYAIFQLTKKSNTEEEIEKLTQRDESYLLEELDSVNLTVWVCFVGGLLLTANYAITYFSGSEVRYIAEWGFTQWTGAFIGLVVTVSITMVQKVLYASPTHHKAGLLVTTLILIFVIFSEIGSPMEKEGMKMAEKSQNSATYKAVVGVIGAGGGASSGSAYSMQLARAEGELAKDIEFLNTCPTRYKSAKRIKKCEEKNSREVAQDRAAIASYKSQMKDEATNNQSTTLALVDKAKALEHNTDNHSDLIKFVKLALGVEFLEAMMLASLILVVAFEAGFHFAGSRAGLLKAALMRRGNEDIKYASDLKRHRKAEKFKSRTASLKDGSRTTNDNYTPPTSIDAMSKQFQPQNVGFKPATSFVSHQPTPTKAPSPDLTDKVKPDLTDKVGKVKPMKVNVLTGVSFDKLYNHVSGQVIARKIAPSMPKLKTCVSSYIKSDDRLKNTAIALPECQYLAHEIRERMQEEGVIIDNPNYKNGLPKYLIS